MSEQVLGIGQRHHLRFDGSQPHRRLEHDAGNCANPWTATIPPSYTSICHSPSYDSASDPSYAHPPVDCSNAPLSTIHPRDASCDLNVNVKLEHEATRPALARRGGRKLRRMTVSSVGLGESEFATALNRGHHSHSQPNPELQSNSNSTSITSWLMRTLSIGTYLGTNKSDGTQGRESELPRTTNKLVRGTTKARTRGKRATSTVSLPPGVGAGGSPLASSLPGSVTDNRAGGGSHTGYGDGDEGAVHRSTVPSAPAQLSYSTTPFIPVRPDTGRKLTKTRKSQAEYSETEPTPRGGGAQEGLVSEHASGSFTYGALFPNRCYFAADVGSSWDRKETPVQIGTPCLTPSQHRWTLADIDDNEFLRQIEARLGCDTTRLEKSRMLEDFVMGSNQDRRDAGLKVDTGYETDESAAEREFARGRRAILCVREIVRTERSYLKSMIDLLQENQSAMSPVLLEYLPGLIEAAARFVGHLEVDPSVWGVSAAFLAVEKQLEEILVKWSGVVGQVISSTRTRDSNQAVSEDGHVYSSTSGKLSSLWPRRRSLPTGALPSQQLRLNPAATPVNGAKSTYAAGRRRLAEQNVVIMPTQRALRYVLMYRELLLHTPLDSLSRPQVELALQGATRIARLCDEAQTLVAMHSPK